MTNTEAQQVLGTMLMRYDLTDAELEAIGMAGEALERDEAKLVLDADRNFSYCPNCESGVSIGFGDEIFIYQFCPNCGQKLKWEETNDDTR